MIYMTIGLQASGKTTYIEKHAPKDAVIISPDKIRREMFHVNYDPAVEEAVWNIFFHQLESALREKKTVIIDNTNVTRAGRALILSIARRYNVPVVAYWFNVPLEECLKRNQERERKVPEEMIHTLHRMYDEPKLEEGFQEIKVIPERVMAEAAKSTEKVTPKVVRTKGKKKKK